MLQWHKMHCSLCQSLMQQSRSKSDPSANSAKVPRWHCTLVQTVPQSAWGFDRCRLWRAVAGTDGRCTATQMAEPVLAWLGAPDTTCRRAVQTSSGSAAATASVSHPRRGSMGLPEWQSDRRAVYGGEANSCESESLQGVTVGLGQSDFCVRRHCPGRPRNAAGPWFPVPGRDLEAWSAGSVCTLTGQLLWLGDFRVIIILRTRPAAVRPLSRPSWPFQVSVSVCDNPGLAIWHRDNLGYMTWKAVTLGYITCYITCQ